jgi:DNA gyrase subunit A
MEEKEFSVKGRGGKGMTYFKNTEKTGYPSAIACANKDDELFIILSSGNIIRLGIEEISIQKRNTSGIRLVSVDNDSDKVEDIAILPNQ